MVHQNAVKFQTETLPVFLEAHQQLMHLCGHSGVISVVTPPSPRPRFMSFWKRKASSTPSGFRPTRCCTTASRTCSSAPSVGRRRKFVGITRTSAIGPAPRRDSTTPPAQAPRRSAAEGSSSVLRELQLSGRHRDAILRFGRFPHRNAVLGRDSTPEEKEYLKEPPSWGLTAEEFAEWEREKAEREAAAVDS